MKDSFVLYTSYLQQIELLTMEQRGALLTAIMQYVAYGSAPDLDGMTMMCFSFVRADIDRNAEKYEKVCAKRREAGKAGGRPKASESKEKQKKQMVSEESKGKQKNPDNDYEYDDEYDDDNNNKRVKTTRFAPPTQEEVQIYVSEHGYKVDAQQFVDFYSAKGWMVGKNKMKDWKAAVRTWDRNQKGTVINRFNNFPQRNYNYDELEAQILGNGG